MRTQHKQGELILSHKIWLITLTDAVLYSSWSNRIRFIKIQVAVSFGSVYNPVWILAFLTSQNNLSSFLTKKLSTKGVSPKVIVVANRKQSHYKDKVVRYFCEIWANHLALARRNVTQLLSLYHLISIASCCKLIDLEWTACNVMYFLVEITVAWR